MICNKYFRKICTILIILTICSANLNGQNKGADHSKADTLKIGYPAPPIVVRKWVKGNPVTAFKPGMVYVVEFWATWCGPCQAVMPHLSKLAEKYKGKTEVLSIDVKEESVMKDKKVDFLPKVERFVKYSGTRMNYTVAVDAEGKNMEKAWLDAAGLKGIPAIFIVDKQGRIAWYGHPAYVDDVLEAVVNDQYNEAARKQIEEIKEQKIVQYDTLANAMMKARMKGNYPLALEYANKAMEVFPSMHNYFLEMKYDFLSHIDSVRARQFGDEVMKQMHPKDQLGQAYMILTKAPDSVYHPDYAFALKWIKQAAAQSDPEDKGVLSMLARAYYKTGNKEEAIYYQKKFIQLLKKNQSITPKMIEQEEKTLQHYESLKK